ncbi:HAMP domain-containing histidine kinase [Bacteroidales bacterium OttesenSCG-928-L03]|nr:HAMP domain-containing histidine kinase [Bacteroidales bacterium OttesenSCG-928-L03]
MNQSLDRAVWQEVNNRHELNGGFSHYGIKSPISDDSPRYIKKEIISADSIYHVLVDRYDPNTNHKIIQYVSKEDTPVNIDMVQAIFENELSQHYPIRSSYLVYIDLEADSVIQDNRPKHLSSSYLASDTVVMDIISSIGMLVFVEMPEPIILKKMTFQLILSIVLILLAAGMLLLLIRSFVFQWRHEKMRQDSIAVMIHEFKRPLSAARIMIDLAHSSLEENNPEDAHEEIDNILLEFNKLLAYTNRIQEINKNDKRVLTLNREPINIRAFFEKVVKHYVEVEQSAQIELTIQTTQETFLVDKVHLSNVVDNLIENAIKYSEREPEIAILVSDHQDGLKIDISDNGIGMSPEELKQLFTKYFRSNKRIVQKSPGFGLGLAYVKSVIDAHNGKILVESQEGKGSIFTILLITYWYGK